MTFTTQKRVLLTLHTIFYRVLKTKIRTKSEIRKTQENRGFFGIVVYGGPSAEPQPKIGARGTEWSEVEWIGVEWNGVGWNNGVGGSGVAWSGVE